MKILICITVALVSLLVHLCCEAQQRSSQGIKQQPVPLLQPSPTITSKLAGEFVWVQGGEFTMGCTTKESGCSEIERPAHKVELTGFYIGKYEVTQAQWKAVMGDNPSAFRGCPKCPVENVSWEDAQRMVSLLNKKEKGAKFRLPTEAEWEYAARGGIRPDSTPYAGSPVLDTVAWYAANAGKRSHVVGGKRPNSLGIYDMSGNVTEWCKDNMGPYSASKVRNPYVETAGDYRIARGGSWQITSPFCTVFARFSSKQTSGSSTIGLRLVREN